MPFPVHSSTSSPHLHIKESWLSGVLVTSQRRNNVCHTWNAIPTSRASPEIQKARRATLASKPTCNKKGTTRTPPWKSTYPCPIPSVLAKCFHPCLNSRPRPQVLYTEVCTQAFAIHLPPPGSSHPDLLIFRLSLCLCAVHFLARQQFVSQWRDVPWNMLSHYCNFFSSVKWPFMQLPFW